MEPVTTMRSTAAAVKTWEESYCERHRCTPLQFRQRVFWRTLHWHALPLAPFLLPTGFFAEDLELIGACGQVRGMRELREELKEFRFRRVSESWLRRAMAIRVSTERLRRLARDYLPGASLPPPFGVSDTAGRLAMPM